jgi:4-hydroxy-tetrahydrodipicolinate synthase
MDTVPKLVQLIKLAQARVDRGRVHVRPPRLPIVDDELREALGVIELAVKTRPRIAA